MEVALIILDGWALADHDHRDAVRGAATPNFDRYRATGAFATLESWGRSVGLPEGGLGNSEVGHLTIGAGRVIEQAHTRINRAIESGDFARNETLASAFDHAVANDARVHLIGLVSDAGVHSDIAHCEALIEAAADREVEAVTHAITDGRDTPPTSGREYIESLTGVIDTAGTGTIATLSGRYFAMDRDTNWKRTHRAYETIVNRRAEYTAPSAIVAIEDAYARDETDEFIRPTLIENTPAITDGDAVITFNFRADRMRQLVRMLADIDPVWSMDTTPPDVRLVTMTEYDETFDLPVAFPSTEPEATLGSVLAADGLTQLRIAETEKYPHVTYFLNGGREIEFAGEHREIVPSPDVPTYDRQPEMSAADVTDTAIDIIEREDPDVLILNYANPDMVGHTGDYAAAIDAVEAVDAQLGRLVPVLFEHGADVVLTADHGNADDMGTETEPYTAHTYNPVPFIYLAADGTDSGKRVCTTGDLSDIAPTILSLLGIDQPAVMTGEPLVE
ncbi:MAG: 2,3-bisphosphoglycerate-independent phosphoglycerate mutase [Halobacteriales archaeon]